MGCQSSKLNKQIVSSPRSEEHRVTPTSQLSSPRMDDKEPKNKRKIVPVDPGSPHNAKVMVQSTLDSSAKKKKHSHEHDQRQHSQKTSETDKKSSDASLPQVENHIKSMVRKVADGEYFDEDSEDEKDILDRMGKSPQHASQNANGSNVAGLDWNQVINEVMGSDLSSSPKKAPTAHAVPHTDVYTRSTDQHIEAQSSKLATKDHDASLLEDEFDFSDIIPPNNHSNISNSDITPSKFDVNSISMTNGASSTQNVTLTLTCDLSKCAEKSEGVHLPLPMQTKSQKFIRYHSFNPKPLCDEIRHIDSGLSDGYDALYCQFEPDTTDVKYSIDLEIEPQSHNTENGLCIGQKTPIFFCSGNHKAIQDIVQKQKWMQMENKEERVRSIAEFVGQLPYHLNLYDQIYYYLDASEPNNKTGLKAVFNLLCEGAGIEEPVDISHLTGYIFPNLRDNIFAKMCFRELIKIEILNKSQDNEFEKYYL